MTKPKAKKQATRTAAQEFRAGANKAIGHEVVWLHYAPKPGIVRVNVERTVQADGETIAIPGRDVDLPFKELSADIQAALKDAIGWVAEDLGASVIEADEEEE